ncbi:DUF3325 domain-containing protein [uncultured Oxalicibacterium sp.]|uniref:DUF3325 domain-containing protein n=1 Tax=uncultured Oxalicibacterium sp. TaxID=1168540 RepID=UPI0025F0D480|nr:DUF3325 domain-containing protein [uncultured Oxalicibacterium sp.]
MMGFGFLTSLAFAYGGWTALSIGMDRHYADMHGRGKEPDQRIRRICRLLGTLALLLTFAACVYLQGWTVGAVLCLGTMTMSALLLVLLLTYAPQRAIQGGQVAAVLGMLFGVLWMVG